MTLCVLDTFRRAVAVMEGPEARLLCEVAFSQSQDVVASGSLPSGCGERIACVARRRGGIFGRLFFQVVFNAPVKLNGTTHRIQLEAGPEAVAIPGGALWRYSYRPLFPTLGMGLSDSHPRPPQKKFVSFCGVVRASSILRMSDSPYLRCQDDFLVSGAADQRSRETVTALFTLQPSKHLYWMYGDGNFSSGVGKVSWPAVARLSPTLGIARPSLASCVLAVPP